MISFSFSTSLAEDPAHRDHVVVGMGREADHPLVARQLRAAPDLGAERVEDDAVERAGRAGLRHERRQAVLGVVALGELEDGLAGLVREPARPPGPSRSGRPVDGAEQPGRRLRVRPRRRRGRGRTWCSGWRCRNVAATSWSTSPSTARRTIAALCSPVARIRISRASRMVATPIVIASRGTFSSPKKSAAASCRVTRSSVISRVRLSAPEPGSLNPMWPVRPMPSSWRSMPPASRMASS